MKKIYIVFDNERQVHLVTTNKGQAKKFCDDYGYTFEQHVY